MLQKLKLAAKGLLNLGRIPVHLNIDSQSYVLRERMHLEDMTHDEKALVDLHHVRIRKHEEMYPTIYFCPLQQVLIKQRIQPGDGKRLPEGLKVELKSPTGRKGGVYNLKNVILHSNGVITLQETPQTAWERICD